MFGFYLNLGIEHCELFETSTFYPFTAYLVLSQAWHAAFCVVAVFFWEGYKYRRGIFHFQFLEASTFDPNIFDNLRGLFLISTNPISQASDNP